MIGMDQLAKSFGLSFKWVFNCTWLDIMPRICPKCKKTKGLDSKHEEYVNVFTKEFVEKKKKQMARHIQRLRKLDEDDKDNDK